MSIVIRDGTAADAEGFLALHRAAAADGTLARAPDEVTDDYAPYVLDRTARGGFFLVAEQGGTIVGAIQTYPMGPRQFARVLGDLTIAVHPAHQGRGIGRELFRTLLDRVITTRPDIARVELFVRSDNAHAKRLYESLGFVEEGRFVERAIGNDGLLYDDIPMGWRRPASD